MLDNLSYIVPIKIVNIWGWTVGTCKGTWQWGAGSGWQGKLSWRLGRKPREDQ